MGKYGSMALYYYSYCLFVMFLPFCLSILFEMGFIYLFGGASWTGTDRNGMGWASDLVALDWMEGGHG
jgi:hypothetical protein